MTDTSEQLPVPETSGTKRKQLTEELTRIGSLLPDACDTNSETDKKRAIEIYNMICELIVSLPNGQYFDKNKWKAVETLPIVWMDKEPEYRQYTEFKSKLINSDGENLEINLSTGDSLGAELRMNRDVPNQYPKDHLELYLNLTDKMSNVEYIGQGNYKNGIATYYFNENGTITSYWDITSHSNPPEPMLDVGGCVKDIVSS